MVEFRLLYAGRENRIYLSTREIMRRLDVGRCKAEKARDELLDRGFVRLLKPGTFSQKTRNASEYALTNEAITQRDGNNAPKDYMTWTPKKYTVLTINTVGAAHQHREHHEELEKQPHGAAHQHRERTFPPSHGAAHQHTGSLPGGTGEARTASKAVEWLKTGLFLDDDSQFRFCLATVALAYHREIAA
ncbi:MAG: hypothetical protein P8011_00475 [Acidihalobacter sp.]